MLLAIALRDILGGPKRHLASDDPKALGAVPFGVPLLVGPAVLATLLLTTERFGLYLALLSLAVNLVVAWLILSSAGLWVERLGRTGVLVISKLAALLLAAYAVMMLRTGIFSLLPPAH